MIEDEDSVSFAWFSLSALSSAKERVGNIGKTGEHGNAGNTGKTGLNGNDCMSGNCVKTDLDAKTGTDNVKQGN